MRRLFRLCRAWPAVMLSVAVLSACGGSPTAPSPTPPPPAPPTPSPQPPPPPPPPPGLTIDRILAFGDSLTEGESTGVFAPVLVPGFHDPSTPGVPTSYPAKLQGLVTARYTAQQVTVYNGGKGGERASEGLSRMDELIVQFTPQAVIIMTGVNDLNGGASISSTADAVEELVKSARARGLTVFLSTIPRQVEGGRRAGSIDEVVPYNLTLARIADKEGATLVDIYPQLTEQYITPDGLHITEAGNEMLAMLYLEAIKAKFEVEPAPAAVFGYRR